MQAKPMDNGWTWRAALSLFILASSTGALYRWGIVYGLPWGLSFANVRHAHSHLMYFGWVTPALMGLIAARLPRQNPRFRLVIAATVVLAALAYLPFLLFGYDVIDIGGHRFPPGVIGASLNILAWYAFAWAYLQSTRGEARSFSLRFFDWALAFQLIASFGAWGRGVLVALKVDDPFVTTAMVDLFLDLFSDGWFVLALLGLAFSLHPSAQDSTSRRAQWLVIAGLPVTFLLGVPIELVPGGLRLFAGAGGLVVAIGLLLLARSLWRAAPDWGWRIPLAFLAFKAFAEMGLGIPALAAWGQDAGLRILYLHVLLLGFVSLGMVAAAKTIWGQESVRGGAWMAAAVIFLITTLIPLTRLVPAEWGGRWALLLAAIGALGPPIVATYMLAKAWQAGRLAQSTRVGVLPDQVITDAR